MAYISLALAKTHLRVDESYTGEDEYIQKLISAALEKKPSTAASILSSHFQSQSMNLPAALAA